MSSEKSPEAMGGERRRTRVPRLMLAAVGPASVWFLYLLVLYGLGVAACHTGIAFPLHVAAIVGIAGILTAGWAGWRHWRWQADAAAWESAAPDAPEDPGPAELERTRFLAIVSVVSAGFFTLLAIGQWAATFILSPCLG